MKQTNISMGAKQEDAQVRASLRRQYIQDMVVRANRKMENEARLNAIGKAGGPPVRNKSFPPRQRRPPSVKINVPSSAASDEASNIDKRVSWKLSPSASVINKNRDRLAAGRRRIRKLSTEERDILYETRPDLRPVRKNQTLEEEANVIDGASESQGTFSATRAIGSFFGTAVTALHEYAYGGASDSSDDDSDDSSQGSCESSDSYASESNSEKSDNESLGSDSDTSPLRKAKTKGHADESLSLNAPLIPVPVKFDETLPKLRPVPKRKEKGEMSDGTLASSKAGQGVIPSRNRSNASMKLKKRVHQAHGSTTVTSKTEAKNKSIIKEHPSPRASSTVIPPNHSNLPSPKTAKNIRQRMAAHRSLEICVSDGNDNSSVASSPHNLTPTSESRRHRRRDRDMKKQLSIGELVTKFVKESESGDANSIKVKSAHHMESAEVLMDLVSSEPMVPSKLTEGQDDMIALPSLKSPRRRRQRPTSTVTKDASAKGGFKAAFTATQYSNDDILQSLEAHEQSNKVPGGTTGSGRRLPSSSGMWNPKSIKEDVREGASKGRTVQRSPARTISALTRSGNATPDPSQEVSESEGSARGGKGKLTLTEVNDENSSMNAGSDQPTARRSPIALRSREFRIARLTLSGSSTSPRMVDYKASDLTIS